MAEAPDVPKQPGTDPDPGKPGGQPISGTEPAGDRLNGSIAVIGAGIAGLTAADQLVRHGLHVKVFDKARSVGGRTSARRVGNLEFDHGAQYFTVRDPAFQRQVAVWLDAKVAAPWHGRIVSVDAERITPSESIVRYVGAPAMNAPAKHLAESLEVIGKTPIPAIHACGGQWVVADNTGRKWEGFDALVVALPPAQAAELLGDLPELARQARGCPFAAC